MRTKTDEKRTAIRQAVLDITVDEGYQNLSMGKIAKRADISPATLYVYYANKEDLLSSVYRYVKDLIDDSLIVPVDLSGDLEAEARAMFRRYATASLAHPKEAFLMTVVNSNPSLVNRDVFDEMMQRSDSMTQLAVRARKEGVIKNLDFDTLIAFTFTPLDALTQAAAATGKNPDSAEVDAWIDMCWDAVKA
jgi:AcrR family transcriptional regulator